MVGWSLRCYIPSYVVIGLALIGYVVLEQKMFESVEDDGQRAMMEHE